MKTQARERLSLEEALQLAADALRAGNDVEMRAVEGGFLVYSVRKKRILRERPGVEIDAGKPSVTVWKGKG